MSQTERILYLDRKIRTNGKVTIKETSEHFEISTRQIKRDIEYLRDRFNAPLIYDTTIKGYRYENAFNKLAFADQKLILFYVIIKSLTESGHYIPIYSDDIITNIEKDVPADYRSVCNKISYQIPQTAYINADFFIDICDGMRDRKCLLIKYINLKDEISERIIEPEQLINYSGNWYILCWDQKHSSLRTFNISRIQSVKITKTMFSKHDKNYKNELKSYISDSFGIFKGQKKSNVKIRFLGYAAKIVESQIWHPEQKIKKNTDNESIDISFPVADFTEVLSKILSFGKSAKPLEPPELVQLWKKEITEMFDATN